MQKSRCLAEWFSAVLLMLCMAVALSAQSKDIDPALLAKANAGDADAEQGIASSYLRLGDLKEYCRWFLKAAQDGSVEAQSFLGVSYEIGSTSCGVSKDYAQAAVWLRKAAEKGDASSANELAGLYDDGKGVPQDYSQAVFWYRKAAEQG